MSHKTPFVTHTVPFKVQNPQKERFFPQNIRTSRRFPRKTVSAEISAHAPTYAQRFSPLNTQKTHAFPTSTVPPTLAKSHSKFAKFFPLASPAFPPNPPKSIALYPPPIRLFPKITDFFSFFSSQNSPQKARIQPPRTQNNTHFSENTPYF